MLPSGSVLLAAVNLFRSNGSPDDVRLPWNFFPYHEAIIKVFAVLGSAEQGCSVPQDLRKVERAALGVDIFSTDNRAEVTKESSNKAGILNTFCPVVVCIFFSLQEFVISPRKSWCIKLALDRRALARLIRVHRLIRPVTELRDDSSAVPR
jgi:hypothetical protein